MPPQHAAKALMRVDPAAKAAVPQLISALKHRRFVPPEGLFSNEATWDYSGAEGAARVLGSLGAEAEDAMPALIAAIRHNYEDDKDDQYHQVRRAAVAALGGIGPGARAALPLLRQHAADRESPLRVAAIIAVTRVDPRSGRELAERWLDEVNRTSGRRGDVGAIVSVSPVGDARAEVLASLGRASLEADSATRSRLELLTQDLPREESTSLWHDDTQWVEWEIEFIAELGVGARLAIPKLRELSEHENPWVRLAAREALAKVSPQAPVPRKSMVPR